MILAYVWSLQISPPLFVIWKNESNVHCYCASMLTLDYHRTPANLICDRRYWIYAVFHSVLETVDTTQHIDSYNTFWQTQTSWLWVNRTWARQNISRNKRLDVDFTTQVARLNREFQQSLKMNTSISLPSKQNPKNNSPSLFLWHWQWLFEPSAKHWLHISHAVNTKQCLTHHLSQEVN